MPKLDSLALSNEHFIKFEAYICAKSPLEGQMIIGYE